MINVSVAIPSYNTSDYIEKAIKPLLSSKYINEIIIQDDCSEIDELKKLESIIKDIKNNSKIDILFFKNENNIGPFKNKNKLVDLCSNDLIYIIDADNIPQEKLDNTIDEIIKSDNKNYIYLPSKIYQFKNFHKISKFMSVFNKRYKVRFSKDNKLIDKKMVIDYVLNDTPHTIDKHLMWVLNLGNFFIYKTSYLEYVVKRHSKTKLNISADPVGICFFYLENKGKIKLIKSFYHYHRKRENSWALMSGGSVTESIELFKKKFLE